MTRVLREVSPTGAYHIMVRGINKQEVFMSSDEKAEYLGRLDSSKQEYSTLLLAFAMMDNHAHLLVVEPEEAPSISSLMLKLNSGYASWYNRRHGRIGPLFQERFRSEAIMDDSHLLAVVRYIHQNPMKIGRSVSYWTSYDDYLNGSGITDTEYVLSMFCSDIPAARKGFSEFVTSEEEMQHIFDSPIRQRNTERQVMKLVEEIVGEGKARALIYLETASRNEHLRRLKKAGLSVRQIESATGISKSVISRA